jgi:hypothetical protein
MIDLSLLIFIISIIASQVGRPGGADSDPSGPWPSF